MRYHEKITEYRQKYRRDPIGVFIDDFEYQDNKRIAELNDPSTMPYVCIAGDFIQGLDMRFVYGIDVYGSSHCEKRAKALFKRLQAFKPRMCSVTVIDRNNLGSAWLGVYTKETGVICE